MFNFTVITLKDIIKYLIKIILIISIIFGITKILPLFKDTTKSVSLSSLNLISCIDSTSEIIKETNKKENSEIKAYSTDFLKDVLKTQIGSIDDFKDDFWDGEKNLEEIENQGENIPEDANVEEMKEETIEPVRNGIKNRSSYAKSN